MTKAKLQAILERLGADSVKKRGRLLLVERGGHSAIVTNMSESQITEHDKARISHRPINFVTSYEDAKGLINRIAERG